MTSQLGKDRALLAPLIIPGTVTFQKHNFQEAMLLLKNLLWFSISHWLLYKFLTVTVKPSPIKLRQAFPPVCLAPPYTSLICQPDTFLALSQVCPVLSYLHYRIQYSLCQEYQSYQSLPAKTWSILQGLSQISSPPWSISPNCNREVVLNFYNGTSYWDISLTPSPLPNPVVHLYPYLTLDSGGKKALIYSICQFPWCKYFHCGQSQVINLMSLTEHRVIKKRMFGSKQFYSISTMQIQQRLIVSRV